MTRRSRTLLATAATVVLLAPAIGWLALRHPATPVPPRESLAFPGVVAVNPGVGRSMAGVLAVDDGRITAVGASTAPDGARRIDALAGAYALPGLIDMHVHHVPDLGGIGLTALWDLLFVAHGVTTVRDLGIAPSGTTAAPMVELRERITTGKQVGPRLYFCGPTLDGDPPFIFHFWPIADPDAARSAVAELAAEGCTCIKTYNNIGPELFGVIGRAAAEAGLHHVAHLPAGVSLADAARVELQHFIRLVTDTPMHRMPDSWAGWDDVDAATLDAIVAHSLDAGITHTPTLSMQTNLLHMRRPVGEAESHHHLLPRLFRELIWTRAKGEPQLRDVTDADLDALARALPKMRRLAYALIRADVPVLLGTDVIMPFGVPGAALHQELREFVAAGLTPEEVLRIATRAAAEYLGEPDLGTLVPGAVADLAFFREDPTRDLGALDTLVGVVADGRYYSREDLDTALAAQRRHIDGWFYDRFTYAVASRMF